MKVFVKTLKGPPFEIEVKLKDTVADVKKNIEAIHGPEVYPVGQQMLIYQGKVLEDKTTMEEHEVSENSFMVIMLSMAPKKNTTAPPPTPAAALPSPPPPTSTITTPYDQAASNMVDYYDLSGVIRQIHEMGEGRWNRSTVTRALVTAFNNPERAIEYLYSGIPASPNLPPVAGTLPPPPPPPTQPPPPTPNSDALNLFPQDLYSGIPDSPNLPPVAGIPPPPPPSTQPLPATPNSDTLNLFPHGLPPGASENLDFLRNSPQFQAFRSRIRADPQILWPMVQELERQNPDLRRLIRDHRISLYRMIFEHVEGTEDVLSESFVITPEDMDAVDRLQALGFNQSVVWDVFYSCDKNEEMTANYLLDHIDEFQD